MTEDATTDTTADPKHASPVPDAHRTDATPEPTLEGEALQEQIAERASIVTTDPHPVAAAEPAASSEPVAETPAEAPAESQPETASEPEPQIAPEPAPSETVAESEPPSSATDESPLPLTTGYEAVADPFAADAQPIQPGEAAPEQEPSAETEKPKPAKKPRAPRAPKAAAAATPVVDADTPAPDVAHPATTDPTGAVDPTATPAEDATTTDIPAEPKPENKKKWYAIKVQSGREDTIKAAILRKVAIEGLEETFGQIMIPFEEVIEKKQVRVKDKKTGDYVTQEKKVTRRKKKFQGYLFAELEFNDRILYLFRETSGVGDFLNLRGTPPVPEPMPEHEVQAMLTGVSVKPGGPSKKVKLEFEKGDRVRIKEGSFANQEGEVTVITEPKDPTDPPKITVLVTFWGRPLPVELEYWQVAKV